MSWNQGVELKTLSITEHILILETDACFPFLSFLDTLTYSLGSAIVIFTMRGETIATSCTFAFIQILSLSVSYLVLYFEPYIHKLVESSKDVCMDRNPMGSGIPLYWVILDSTTLMCSFLGICTFHSSSDLCLQGHMPGNCLVSPGLLTM